MLVKSVICQDLVRSHGNLLQVRLCVDFRVLGSTDHFHHMIKSATDNSHLIDTFC